MSEPDLTGRSLLSLDVFDTLLWRTCGNPAALYARMEPEARQAGWLNDRLPPGGFPALRQQIEAQARQAAGGEVVLDEIYAQLPASLGNGAQLRALEFSMEARHLVPDPAWTALMAKARQAGVTVWLISDTWYRATELASLLAGAGIEPGLYDRLIVSCEAGACKQDGSLFAQLAATTACSGWLHVGDNVIADVIMPRRHGIASHHHAPPCPVLETERCESLLGLETNGLLRGLRRLSGQRDKDDGLIDQARQIGQTVIGPAVLFYCLAVLEDCQRQGIRTIAPLEREGRVFAEILRTICDARGWQGRIETLHVSREALFVPSRPTIDRGIAAELAALSTVQTPRGLARLLKLPAPDMLVDLLDRPLIDVLSDAREVSRVGDWLEHPSTRNLYMQVHQRQYALAVAYLSNRLGDPGPVATLDLGARGSTQAILGRLPGLRQRYHFHHHLLYAVADLHKHLGDGQRWVPFSGLDADCLRRAALVYRSPQLLELALVGDRPTTIGYEERDGKPEPSLETPVFGLDQRAILQALRDGVKACVRQALPLLARPAWREGALDTGRTALAMLHRLVHLPLPAEVAVARALSYDYNVGTGIVQPLIPATSPPGAADFDFADRLSLSLQRRPSQLPWPQAALAVTDPDAAVAMAEAMDGRAAHAVYARLLLRRLAVSGSRRILVCGAGGLGGMGPIFLTMARAQGVQVVAYADALPDLLPDTEIEGVRVVAMADTATLACADIAIVSLGYGRIIAAQVRESFARAGLAPRLHELLAAEGDA